MVYIYGLYSIDENIIRYVGKTNNLQKRLKYHIYSSKRYNKTHKERWINKELKENNNINIKILEKCDENIWEEREKFWISKFINLTNLTDGGDGTNCNQYKISYEEAKSEVKRLNIKSQSEWFKFIKLNKINLPHYPNEHYKNDGWKSWGDFFGTNVIYNKYLTKDYLSYEEAKNYIKDNNLNINTIEEWKYYIKNVKNNKFIPNKPDRFYKNKGWISWGDFLGTGRIATQHRTYIDFETAKILLKNLNIISEKEFHERYFNDIEYLKIPKKPRKVYKEKWSGWKNFLN